MSGTLGGQVATVIEQLRAQHNSHRDGARRPHEGCSLQPRGAGREAPSDGREQTTAQWDLYAPAGFRASATDQLIVEPGPTGPDGAPARLSFDGAPQPWWDLDGTEDHVHAVVRLLAAPKESVSRRT